MTLLSSTSAPDLQAVTAALGGVRPRPSRVVLFGSRARGEARPDSDIDLLVVMPQPTLTATERQLALRSLRAALRPLPLKVGVDLVVVGADLTTLMPWPFHASPTIRLCSVASPASEV